MNYLDIFLGSILAYGLIRGLFKGLILELSSLLALIVGIYGALHFSHILGDFLQQYTNWNPNNLRLVAVIGTFILLLLGVTLLGKMLTKVAKLAALGMLNRMLGGIFGLLKMILITGVLMSYLLKANQNLGLVDEGVVETSVLFEPVATFSQFIFGAILEQQPQWGEVLPQT